MGKAFQSQVEATQVTSQVVMQFLTGMRNRGIKLSVDVLDGPTIVFLT